MDFTEFKTGQDDINRRADKVIKKILTNWNFYKNFFFIKSN